MGTWMLVAALLAVDSTFVADGPAVKAPAGKAVEANGDAGKAAPKAAAPKAPDAPPGASDLDKLVFDQEKVEREMAELEMRMFRLGDALANLEPENASRLRLALKYARDELIQLKMKTSREALGKKQFAEAASEQRTTLQRLQRLEDLLLARDLDFQMKLERLRKMTDVLKQLDQAIDDEQRQMKESRKAEEAEEKAKRLAKRGENLDKLIREQRQHNQKGAELAKADAGKQPDGKADAGKQPAGKQDAGKSAETQAAAAKLANAQSQTKAGAEGLAKEQPSPNLSEAAGSMGKAAGELGKGQPKAAAAPQRDALAALEKEQQANAAAQADAKKQQAGADLKQQQRDENRNQKNVEDIASAVRQLGQAGAGALPEVQNAAGKQGQASQSLGQGKPGEASPSQQGAKQALEYAKQQLQQEREKLLGELAPEVRTRVMANLEKMLAEHVAVRTGTEAAKGAGPILAKLAPKEEAVGKLADETIFLCEETEFSIALPDSLRVVREMLTVASQRLAKGDGGPAVLEIEKRIEDDLRDLLEAMKKMPSQRVPKDGKPKEGQEKQKELNKLIAELKMVRMMQKRVNGETVKTFDGAPAPPLPPPLRELVGRLEKMQTRVRDTTARISETRERDPEPGDQPPAPDN